MDSTLAQLLSKIYELEIECRSLQQEVERLTKTQSQPDEVVDA